MRRWLARLSVLVVVVLLGIPAADAGLHGYWPLDGDVTDATGTNNGTFSGGTATYVADRNGSPGSALQFDGILEKVTVGTTGRPTNTFTFCAWLKTSETHQIDPEATSGTQGTSGQNYAFGARHQSTNGGAGMSVGTNGISVYEHGGSYMPALAVFNPGDNTTVGSGWNHIAVVYDSKQPTIYLNGTAVHTGLTSLKGTVYSPYEFGRGSYGELNGPMDDVAIWDHALCEAQVQRLAAGVSPPDSGAVLINPSFEADTFTVYPGYISGNGPITGWTASDPQTGINPAAGSPFADNGTIPDGSQVAFIQRGGHTLSQTAIGFKPGENYIVTFRENSRAATAVPDLSVSLGGQTVVAQHSVPAVGGSNPYHYVGSAIFNAASSANTLTFSNDTAGTTDATALIDDVQIHRMYLKFSDNYNTVADTTSINPNPANDDPGRQGGQFAPLTYAETNAAKSQISGDRLLIAGTGINKVSPNRNFDLNGLAPAHFVLEFNVDPGAAPGDDWAAVVLGSSLQTASVNTSDGVGMLFDDAGGYQIFDGTSGINNPIKSGSLPGAGGAYDVRINYFVPGFDDVTSGMVNIWVNDAFVHSFITDSGFANNYINLIGYSGETMDPSHVFDDLRIYSSYVPEPATLALLGGGLLVLWRRRKRA